MNQHESVLLIKEPVQTSLGQNNLQKKFFFFFPSHGRWSFGSWLGIIGDKLGVCLLSFCPLASSFITARRLHKPGDFCFIREKVPMPQEDPRKEPWVSQPLSPVCLFCSHCACGGRVIWRLEHTLEFWIERKWGLKQSLGELGCHPNLCLPYGTEKGRWESRVG